MSISALSVQTPNVPNQREPAALPPKQATEHTANPQDKVTISESAKQALTGNAKSSA